ncbi:alpha/beta-hydrolase [Zopfia rhizophila CBS 207.26]|uniref:Alpha/beta-hydrolase n=1 Tax=Zopfia rhizophila CBS 207.26 TaxID=1314779 RepID=A0A6A6DIY6_9PEZI|nr:alpha/beta-hydrolase [Zopfia rhizophila CBS 207.26]
MASSSFDVKEHVIPCQHIRGYPHAAKDPTAVLRLAIKEYAPKEIVDGATQAVTIIAAHANGIPKETYEPLWEALRIRLTGRLKAIWIADCSHQGASGILNENVQGDDPNWFDHSRDLLAMVNHFRDSIKPPIVGIAHSMGCAQLVQLSHIHPRLFQSLVLIEPVIQEHFPPGPNAALLASYKPDLWNSLEEAQSYFQNNKFYKTWDDRALNLYLQYGLRKTPTALFPDAPPGSVTLRTTKHQEAWSYVRSSFSPLPPDGLLDEQERLTTGDLNSSQATYLFHRAEPGLAFHSLPYLQPSVLWVFAKQSYINKSDDQEEKVSRTGTAVRSSGGRESGAVETVVIDRAGHLLPLEKIEETADMIAPYIDRHLTKYQQQDGFWDSFDSGKSERGRLALSQKWMKEVRKKADVKRPVRGGTKL